MGQQLYGRKRTYCEMLDEPKFPHVQGEVNLVKPGIRQRKTGRERPFALIP